ncbi:YeeE/YedE thiosulfate transporter family protein [Methylobacterium sp. 77]|uniref:YeeE/YedE family protein n=1 Tax=Methylobacterium sp. 77 TaxID=1101192 RepID=UPI000374344E|nr:YeeE/YedE thiosulfate transporter family protein [Methylobacterium sp. 77]
MNTYLSALAGGALIGTSAALLLILNGRIAGISGIAAGAMRPPSREVLWRWTFLAGLLLGPILFRLAFGAWPVVQLDAPWILVVLGGLLVGYGTRLGGGCTSGHGVCGLARLSPRSIAAVATFMVTAAATVFLVRHGGW